MEVDRQLFGSNTTRWLNCEENTPHSRLLCIWTPLFLPTLSVQQWWARGHITRRYITTQCTQVFQSKRCDGYWSHIENYVHNRVRPQQILAAQSSVRRRKRRRRYLYYILIPRLCPWTIINTGFENTYQRLILPHKPGYNSRLGGSYTTKQGICVSSPCLLTHRREAGFYLNLPETAGRLQPITLDLRLASGKQEKTFRLSICQC